MNIAAIAAIGFLIATMPVAFAQDATAEASAGDILEVNAGAAPDSWMYGFKRFGETMQTWLTFDPEAKANLKYKHAQIRLAEAALMLEKNKTEFALKAIGEYERGLNETSGDAERLAAQGKNATKLRELVGGAAYKHILVLQTVLDKIPAQAKPAIEKNIERSFERHKEIAERFDKGSVNLTISINNRVVTKQVPARLAEEFLEKASEMKEKFNGRLKEVNITGKEELAERIAEKIEIRREKADEKIRDAKEAIEKAAEKIAESGANATAADKFISEARRHMEAAESAFNSGKYGEAFAHAVASENQAEHAGRFSSIKERISESREENREGIKERIKEKSGNKSRDIDSQISIRTTNEAISQIQQQQGS